ncbi:erythromycin esterase family protein [bacterium]|nr:erythromycin esterase family protein [bacterium]
MHPVKKSVSAVFTITLILLSCSHSKSPNAPESPWLGSHAVILDNADPGSPDPALEALRDAIADARIVGLGEGTHGTMEFWGIRQKISEFLVREMGFTAILMEAGFPNSLDIENYISKGEGSGTEAHKNLTSWKYQEMRDLIDWMREYNLEQTDSGRMIHYLGYDCAFRDWDRAAEVLSGYLDTVDPESVPDVAARLENYTIDDARWVHDLFISRSADYIGRSDSLEYGLMLRIIENLEPSWTVWYNLANGLPDLEVRDAFNIGNVRWIIDTYLGGAKVVIWAHNGHVGNTILIDNAEFPSRMLGLRLRDLYGDDYYVIGTEFWGGQFMAWNGCEDQAFEFTVHQAAVPPENSYAYRFHKDGPPLFFLDLRHTDVSMNEAAWLAGPLNMRFIGATYCALEDRQFYRSMSMTEEFDGLVFFETTNPATPVTF